eukprot:jgi/Botrbrau1/22747/Bobra.0132s0080.1
MYRRTHRRLVPTKLVVLSLSILLDISRASKYIEDPESFPGWKGELPGTSLDASPDSIGASNASSDTARAHMGWDGHIEELSWKPRAFLLKSFLSHEECDHLVSKASPKMMNSTVVDNETGKSIASTVRTSTGTFFGPHEDSVIQGIEERIAVATHFPEENGEGIQVLHYVNGQKYEPHHDFFHDKYNARAETGGQRVATVLMYLSTPEEGGETIFPNAGRKVTGPGWSKCALKGLAVKAKKGDALLFYSMDNDHELDFASLHGSCPTLKGEKWSATKWIHEGAFSKSLLATSGICVDDNEMCGVWAKSGECSKNPGYMKAACRKSCNTCTEKQKAATDARKKR